MKYLVVLACICLLCASPTLVCADVVDGIEMLSQSYEISAQWSESFMWRPCNYPGCVPLPVPPAPTPCPTQRVTGVPHIPSIPLWGCQAGITYQALMLRLSVRQLLLLGLEEGHPSLRARVSTGFPFPILPTQGPWAERGQPP